MNVGRQGRGRHRRFGAAVLVAVLLAAVAPGAGAGAQTDRSEASDTLTSGGEILGTASAQVLTVVPLVGDVGLPLKFGVAGAQSDGKVRRASSHVADLGLLGSLATLAIVGAPTLNRLGIPVSEFASGIQLPGGSLADSRGATDVEARPVLPEVPLGPVAVGGGHQEAKATEGGTAFARTELEDTVIDLGVAKIELNGGIAETIADASHVEATTTFGELRVITGTATIATLKGLVWRLEHKLDQEPVASFTIGSGSFGRVTFPVPATGLDAMAEALTRVLSPIGLSLTMPAPRPDGGLTPLRVALDDSPLGAALVRPVYSALLADAVNQTEAAIVGGVPETGLAVTVANVVLSALTGQGGAAVELGGLSGTMGRRPIETFTYASFAAPPRAALPAGSFSLGSLGDDAGGSLPVSPPTSFTGAAPKRPDPAPAPAPAPQPPSTLTRPAAAPSQPRFRLASVVADESFPALLVVLGGLGAALAMAALDRRRIADLLREGGAA